jgi:soluble lytic murein transglycosylase
MLSKFTKSTALAVLTCSLGALPALAQAPSGMALNRADEAVLEMGQAFNRADKARLAALLPQTRGHVLEPWAAYWELRNRLEQASVAEVQAFFARYAGSYQEDRMRNDWLLLLGQRRDWTGFAVEHPQFRMGDDREVRCFAWFLEHQKNGAENSAALADQVRQTWYAQRDADEGCRTAAERMLAAKQLTSLDIWRKARLSIEAGRTRPTRDAVEMVAPDALGLLAALQANPAKFLADKKIALTRVRKEIITLALVKLAASDPEAAAKLIDKKWDFQLSAEERNWVWGVIGKQSAMRMGNQRPDALAYFYKVSADSDLSDDMLGWKTRAALRAGQQPRWPLVLASINAMSADARKDPTWIYWKARALSALAPTQPATLMAAQRAEALALLQSIASVRGFYEQLALEELGQLVTVPPAPAVLTADEKEAARSNAGLQRGAYAIAIGLRSEGVREWNYATNLAKPGGMNERELLAAAQLACDKAIWDRCINTSDRTRNEIDFSQRFPTPFREAVLKRSRDIGIDPAYVYGLIRQESRFINDARSVVGASGLMQIMPATARETARQIGLTGFKTGQLNDRDTNIAIGTAYLKRALDDFGGSMAMAAAAYNAGPSRPRNWRNGPPLEAAIWAENVPFHETRDYVKKVLSNTTSYAALLTGQPQSLKARLGTVAPREVGAPPIDDKMP